MKEYSYTSNRYPNGYQPKIEYYQAKLALAVDALDIDKIKFLTGKLEYFLDRHAAINGRLESIS
mgnify:CR=1 FL=1|tara:strand:+ start:747 stop:938 length:192 start_codon:yes stop_codon:yes gene_type:complete